MMRTALTLSLCAWLCIAASVTASLGQEPESAPPAAGGDFYPIYVWDHIGQWGNDLSDPERLAFQETMLGGMAQCALTMPGFISPQQLPLTEKYGFKTIIQYYEDLEEQIQKIGGSDFANLTDEQADTLAREMTADTKDNPNVLGYYLCDEPGADQFPGLARLTAAIKKYAPGKLAYINLFPTYASTIGADRDSQLKTHTYEEYLERYVQEVKPMFLSYDNYMVEYSEDMILPDRADIYWNNLLEVRRVAMKYHLPWWNIVSSLAILPESTPPTPARLAFQAYTSLAAGASGLGWFLYYPCCGFEFAPVDRHWNRTIVWGYLREVNQQIRTLGTYLNRFRSSDVWFSTPTVRPNLPENPKTLLSDLKVSFTEQGPKDHPPCVMVGQFEAKEGDECVVMFVNLDFANAVKVEPAFLEGEVTLRSISPEDGTVQKMPSHGWRILPGHGVLLTIEQPR